MSRVAVVAGVLLAAGLLVGVGTLVVRLVEMLAGASPAGRVLL